MIRYTFYDLKHGGRVMISYHINRGEIDESSWHQIIDMFGDAVTVSNSEIFADIDLGRFSKRDRYQIIEKLDRLTGKVPDDTVDDLQSDSDIEEPDLSDNSDIEDVSDDSYCNDY